MTWYAAHLLVCTKYKKEKQTTYPVWENIVLIEADSDEQANEKALLIGKEYEGDAQGTYFYEDKPAIDVFVGIRKIIECNDSDEQPKDGTEISYSRMVVEGDEALSKLIDGEEVDIIYED